MKKMKVLFLISLVVLLFCGCENASDSSKDQAPTPIEEEREIQDASEMILVDNGELKTEEVLGTYFVEKKLVFQFGEKEIFNDQELIGRYVEGLAYFDLQKIADRLGWTWLAGDGLSIGKGNLQYQFDEISVQRIFLDERGSPYEWQFPPMIEGESMMIAQVDAESLFGLQSRWNPEARTLVLIEWGWHMPENIEIDVRGDRLLARMEWKSETGEEEIIDDFPWIRLVDGQGKRFSQGGHGQSENGIFVVETEGRDLLPGIPWLGSAEVNFRGRLIGIYSLLAEFEGKTGEIQTQTGPWEDFTLESPNHFYIKKRETLLVKGTTEDKWVEMKAFQFLADEFKLMFEERQQVDEAFTWKFAPKEPGIYRIDMWTEENKVRQKRTHFYYEKE